jgi:hypothetical protein
MVSENSIKKIVSVTEGSSLQAKNIFFKNICARRNFSQSFSWQKITAYTKFYLLVGRKNRLLVLYSCCYPSIPMAASG